MKRKIIGVILSAVCLISLMPVAMADASVYTIYVSPDGSDENDGTLGSELATLQGAKNRVRQLKRDYDNIEVVFREGTYRFSDSVIFTEEDSAPEGGRITYKGAEGEKVYFKGSKVLDKSKFTAVSDSDMISRLPDSSKVLAVKLSDFGIVAEDYTIKSDGVDDYILFADGERQREAMWPNGEEEFALVSSYDTSKLTTWKNADEVYIKAYWANDYNSYKEKVAGSEVEAKINAITSDSKRFKVLNIAEELDTPGEWYIDRDKNILYYYPYEDFAEAEIELAFLTGSMITLYYTDRVDFQNIHFSESRGSAIKSAGFYGWDVLATSEDVNIKNCIFSGLGYTAVFAGHWVVGYIEGESYERNTLNYWTGVKDWTIDGNCFYDLSYGAILLDSGAVSPLASGNSIIKNNYIYNTNLASVNHAAVWIRHGVGDTVENNVIHHIPYHAINYNGNNHLVKRNELYNATRLTIDCGVVYTGRSFYQRGSVVEENYIHDSNPVEYYKKSNGNRLWSNNAIYFDDTIGGQTARNNLIVNVQRGVCANGSQGNTVDGNIMYECEYNTHLNDNFLTDESTISRKDSEFDRMKHTPGFVDEYPEVMEIYDNYKTEFALNRVKDNIAFKGTLKAAFEIAKEENNTIENNQVLTNTSEFETAVNAKNGVFSFNNGVFTTSGVGILKNDVLNDVIYEEFKVRFPADSHSIKILSSCRFGWESATGADSYRIEFSKDESFGSIAYSTESDYNFCDVTIPMTMSAGNYCWRVVAVNKSSGLSNEWTSDTGRITVKGWF